MSSSSSDGHALDLSQYTCNRGLPILRWPYDENGQIVLMSIPSTIDLTKSADQVGPYGGRSFTSLPSELHWAILKLLSPVDRVCWGLTCKKFAATIIAGPRPNPEDWYIVQSTWHVYYAIPDYQHLLPRLAHGWIDKTKYRYCWKCCKLRPRDPQYFRQRLQSSPKPDWRMKVGMDEKQWRRLRKSERYEQLIKIWCDDKYEDSSVLSCNECRKDFVTAYSQRVPELFKQSPETACYELSIQQPIQCPTCFGAELCKKKPPPPKGRPLWYRILRPICSVIFIGVSMVLYVLYFILIKIPWIMSKKAWKKIKPKSGPKLYWRYWYRKLKLRFQHE